MRSHDSGPVVEVHGLVKVYRDRRRGEIRAVDGLEMTARPGRIFGLLGPNGAGKTTALRILATILAPSAGTARICGADVVGASDRVRKHIGYVSGDTGIYDRLTPRELVQFFGGLHGMDRDALERRSVEIFEMLDLAPFADRLGAKLSAGNRQKTSVARAVIHDPAVLIADEPTVHLDIMSARSVFDFLVACAAGGTCVILSTHDLTAAARLCDEVMIIDGGRVVGRARPAELPEGLEDFFFSRVAAARRNPGAPS